MTVTVVERPGGRGVVQARSRTRGRGPVVAVTGAAGTLGAEVVTRLAADPAVARVLAVDLVPGAAAERVEWRTADVRDPLLARTLAGATTLVHLAGRHRLDVPPAERRAVNVRGTANALTAATTAGVDRVVLVTSAMVYGAHPDNPLPLTEDAPLRGPRDDSLVGDFLEIERLVEDHQSARTRTTCTVLRPTTLVGPGADSVLTRHFEAPRLLTVRGGAPAWQFLHLDDLATACVLAATGALAGTVNLAPSGWLTQSQVEAVSGLRRLEVPPAVAYATAERLHRARLTPAPASDLSYLVHPWAVANDRALAGGWTPTHDNESALRAQMALAAPHTTVAARRLDRDDATKAAAGATVALLGTAALVRRARRRRR
jgi:nucleoside-diphosphate-sugar epimerase